MKKSERKRRRWRIKKKLHSSKSWRHFSNILTRGVSRLPFKIFRNKKLSEFEFRRRRNILTFDLMAAFRAMTILDACLVSLNTNFGFASRHPKWLLYLNEE